MALSEAAMIETIRDIVAQEPDPDWYEKTRGKTELVRRLVLDRRPQGQCPWNLHGCVHSVLWANRVA